MYSKPRIRRKAPIYSNRSDQRKEDSVEIRPISLKRPEIKLPSISSKMSPRREISINLKVNPIRSTPTHIANTPSPHHLKSGKSFQTDLSFNLFHRKHKMSNIQKSVDISRPLNSTSIITKNSEETQNTLRNKAKLTENLKKLVLNYIHSSSSDVSSSESIKEDTKKFESPALWQAGKDSMHSYISENSYLKQISNSHGLQQGAAIDEVEETSDVVKFNELKFKLIVQDSINDGIKGRIRRWKAGEILGVGSYAQVFKAFDVNTGEIFAVKRILFNPSNKFQCKFIQDFEAEVEILRGIHNKYVVRYLGSEAIQDNFCIYLEYLPGGSLSKLLYSLGALSEITARAYLTQILKGLSYLHNNGVIHRDIKGANILLDSKGKIKISDFGCSKQYQSSDAESGFITSLKGSLPWMAPEVIKQKGYGRKADIWSVGCVALEMLTAKKPWDAEDNHVIFMMKIIAENTIPNIPEGISESAKDFLMNCFQRDPKMRLSAKQLLKHTFLRKLGN